MTIYEGTTIYHTRGDTLIAQVTMTNADGTEYQVEEGDRVRFYLKRKTGESPILVREIPTDTLQLRLEADETKTLGQGVVNGHYKYDVELSKANGLVDTFINMADLYILEEV